jgi:hypothetical protein
MHADDFRIGNARLTFLLGAPRASFPTLLYRFLLLTNGDARYDCVRVASAGRNQW